MKHLKLFENISGSRRNNFLKIDRWDGRYRKPEIGDYIFGESIDADNLKYSRHDEFLYEFLYTHIGKVLDIYISGYGETCRVIFDEDFEGQNVFLYQINKIKFWSKNKKDVEEDAEEYIAEYIAKKYNL